MSLSSPAGCDALVEAALRNCGGNQCAQAGDEAALPNADKRTVRRRLARLRERAPALGITPWVSRVDEKLPELDCTVGSVRLPSTSNAVERFFRAFQRFYRTRGVFNSVLSAKRELLLFLVVYMFTQHATTGQAPIEVIMPEARRMPVYRLINDPFRALQERGNVKGQPQMADLLRPQEVPAYIEGGETMQRSPNSSPSTLKLKIDRALGPLLDGNFSCFLIVI